MPGQRPVLNVLAAPGRTYAEEDHFLLALETNMQDLDATVDITTSVQPIADCGHAQCRELDVGIFHGYLKHQELHGRRGAKRKQFFDFDCFLSDDGWHRCSLWHIVCRLSLPTKDANGYDTGRRFVAKTTHTLTHRNISNPETRHVAPKARAFAITKSLTWNGQRPWLRVVEAPTIAHHSAQSFPITLETNIIDPGVEIEHFNRNNDGEDYDDLDLYPEQDRLDWEGEFVLDGYFKDPTIHRQKRNFTLQYKMDGCFDTMGGEIDSCDSWRIIFTISKEEGCIFAERKVLAVAEHIITRAPRETRSPQEKNGAPLEWAPEVVLKKPHGKGRRF